MSSLAWVFIVVILFLGVAQWAYINYGLNSYVYFLLNLIFVTGTIFFMMWQFKKVDKDLSSHKGLKLFEDLSIAIIAVDKTGKIILLNNFARKISGISSGESQINILQKTYPTDTPLYFLTQTLQRDEEFHEQYYNYQDAQDVVYMYLSTTKTFNESGQPEGALLIACRVSEQAFLSRHLSQRGKLAMIGELAAGTAHEIRNPLTSIKGLIQLIEQRFPQDDSARQHIFIILKEIEQINSIIKELLLLARRTTPNLSFASLPAMLDQVLLLVEGETNIQGINIIKDYNDQLPLMILDEDQIKQVFLHLATNAIYAMPTGGELKVSAKYIENKKVITVSFSDTGIGIKKETISRLFQPFFTTRPEGTGLGLPVSYQIVDNHGGKLSVNSEPGKGSIFTVTLPLAKA